MTEGRAGAVTPAGGGRECVICGERFVLTSTERRPGRFSRMFCCDCFELAQARDWDGILARNARAPWMVGRRS